MKVIHILNELKFSGAEVMYVAAAKTFQQSGCDLAVVNTNEKLGAYASFFEKAGYQVFHKACPKSFTRKFGYYYHLIRFLKKNHYQVVHIHHMMWGMAFCAWMAGCRSVYTFHSVFYSRKITLRFHRFLRWSAKKIFHCTFQTIGDSVCEHEKKYYRNETIKIYNWYDSNRFYPAKEGEKNAVRTELNINKDQLVLISIGGCSPIKRHTEIIKALPYIIERYPNTVYIHLGEGDMLTEEQDLVKTLQLSDHVRFCGNQIDVRKYLVASDIYLMTSIVEGVSITAIEVMASKTPAILYDVPGLRDFNNEKECTLLSREDHLQLAGNIILLYEDKDKQRKLTDNARSIVDKYFDMRTNVHKILNLYQML